MSSSIYEESFIEKSNVVDGLQIDDYIFKLLYKNNTNGRPFVVIQSINTIDNTIKHFLVYRSFSEGGIWRIFSGYDQAKYFNKGVDYITSSNIHILLQLYINEQYDKLDTKEYILGMFTIDDKLKSNIVEVENIVNNKLRINKEAAFDVLQFCDTGLCFQSLYSNKITTMLASIRSATIDANFKSRILSFIVKYMYKDNDNNKIKIHGESLRELYNIMSYYMGLHFTKISERTYIGKMELHVKLESMYVTILHNVYNIKIKSNESSTVYDVIYSKYTFVNHQMEEHGEERCKSSSKNYSGEYNIILNIVPENAKINQYGLYDKIVSVGSYIYKPFEYIFQVNINKKDRPFIDSCRSVSDKTLGDKGYYFIGDILSNVWPINLD